MIQEHHKDIIRATADVVKQRAQGFQSGLTHDVAQFLTSPRLEQIAEWTAAFDTIQDVVIDEQFSGIDPVSGRRRVVVFCRVCLLRVC